MSLYVEAKHIFLCNNKNINNSLFQFEYIDAFGLIYHQKTHLIAPDAYKDITHAIIRHNVPSKPTNHLCNIGNIAY